MLLSPVCQFSFSSIDPRRDPSNFQFAGRVSSRVWLGTFIRRAAPSWMVSSPYATAFPSMSTYNPGWNVLTPFKGLLHCPIQSGVPGIDAHSTGGLDFDGITSLFMVEFRVWRVPKKRYGTLEEIATGIAKNKVTKNSHGRGGGGGDGSED